ncbi:MAG: MAPEG family protein [Woeseiaceae bacterium]|nr:MAPEG family protein [Woeseiaceae bacterium]
MSIPVTLTYASFFAIFALILSFRAGTYRGKAGVSVLYGDPANMELAQRIRVHQNFLEYVPMILIVMGALEASGVSRMFLYVVGDLLVIARIAHAVGLKHDNMSHIGRLIGAGGTALITLVVGVYGLWLGASALMA